MVDKAKKRLKALAREQGISLRAAGNIMAERRPPAGRGYGLPGGSPQKPPVENGAFVFDGTSGPPDGDGFFLGDGKSPTMMGPFLRDGEAVACEQQLNAYSVTDIRIALDRVAEHPLRGPETSYEAFTERGKVKDGRPTAGVSVRRDGDTYRFRLKEVTGDIYSWDELVMKATSFSGFVRAMSELLRGAMRIARDYPFSVGGTTKYEKKDLSFVNGDFELENGDLKLIFGAEVLDQRMQRAVESSTATDTANAVRTAALGVSLKDYLDEVTVVRFNDETVEVGYKPVGYPPRTVRISRRVPKPAIPRAAPVVHRGVQNPVDATPEQQRAFLEALKAGQISLGPKRR
jgi:hypothetical protein